MNAYYFNVTKEEKENILDKHKTLYDGYVTMNKTSNLQPLTVQDLANDKGGVTLNNKGVVTTYKNFGINESVAICEACGLNEEECKCEEEMIEEDVPMVDKEEEMIEQIDDELVEEFKEQRKEILEMFNRIKNF